MKVLRNAVALLAVAVAACSGGGSDLPTRVLLATTTTVEDSGLLEALIAGFEAAHPDHALQVGVSGSGQALELGRLGDVDVLLTHSPLDERVFMEEGYGTVRREVMESDFVLLRPPADPADVGTTRDVRAAFRKVAAAGAPFVSRGDDSGTHRAEQTIWHDADVTPGGDWYIVSGVGMADALRIASEREAYVLSDLPTFLAHGSTIDLEVAVEGDDLLLNPYAVIGVRRAVNARGAQAFIDWITGPDGQALIGGYGASGTGGTGESLFRPLAPAVPD